MSEMAMNESAESLIPPTHRHHGYGSMVRRASASMVAGRRYRMTLPWATEPESPTKTRYRYTAYYLPFLSWLPQYRWRWLRGDVSGALTVASLYIPMCFSFSILATVNPISGLYAFIIHPLIYAFLGSCPQMVVGPEATGSLLVGSILRQIESVPENDSYAHRQISGTTTAIAGAILLAAGISRIGFVDSMLSRPFMQGFISGVGFVLVVEQAIPELGLVEVIRAAGYNRRSAVVKLYFLLTHLSKTHIITAAMAFSTLAFILVFR